jgi:hypothetical protein
MDKTKYQIYRITNTSNGRVYVGMTKKSLKHRLYEHMKTLGYRAHQNDGMQADYDSGDVRWVIERITGSDDRKVAKEIETSCIDKETNPYNIATGKPGAFIGRGGHRWTDKIRPYIYSEIIRLGKTESNYNTAKRFGCSTTLVSFIRNGLRVAPLVETLDAV